MRAPFDPRQQDRAGPDTFADAPSAFHDVDAEEALVDAQPWHLIYAIAYGSLLLPALLSLAVWFKGASWHAMATTLLVTHLALVLSFLGGVHWGIALRFTATNARMPAFHFIWGPMPGYLAWLALQAEARLSVGMMMLLAAWTFWIDHRTWPGSGLGPWLPLRRVFAIGTLAYCAVAIVGLSR